MIVPHDFLPCRRFHSSGSLPTATICELDSRLGLIDTIEQAPETEYSRLRLRHLLWTCGCRAHEREIDQFELYRRSDHDSCRRRMALN